MKVNTRTCPISFSSRSRSKDPASILEHFAELPDPRREHGKIHMLDEIVFMSISAVLCGADSWQEIADYSQSKSEWLNTFLTLPGWHYLRTIRSAASTACSTLWPSRRVSPTGSLR